MDYGKHGISRSSCDRQTNLNYKDNLNVETQNKTTSLKLKQKKKLNVETQNYIFIPIYTKIHN